MPIDQPFSIQRTRMLNTINRMGKGLSAIGLDPFRLKTDSIIKKAKKNAGYSQRIPDNIIIGMNKLVDSINQEARPNPFGKLAVKTLFERTLTQRLLIDQFIKQNPDVVQDDIKEPIFIIGMPRTGTTILHALMHEDPQNRSPLAWECLLPYPAPTPDNFKNNTQLHTVQKEFGQLFKLVPDFKKKHHMEADSPQECLGINAFDFNSFQTAAQLYIPSYMNWFLNASDQLGTMQFHKRFLQFLQSGGVKGERWLLKSPVHLMRLKEIFEVYPDAKIIMTHRTPTKVVPSAASLVSSVRSLYSDHEDPLRTGKEMSEIWSQYFNLFLEARRKLDKEEQIIDLKFEDFVGNQLEVVKKIYQRFNWKLSDEAQQNMEMFLARNPKDKYGAHQYTLEDFGLNDSDINEQFKDYNSFLNTL